MHVYHLNIIQCDISFRTTQSAVEWMESIIHLSRGVAQPTRDVQAALHISIDRVVYRLSGACTTRPGCDHHFFGNAMATPPIFMPFGTLIPNLTQKISNSKKLTARAISFFF